MLQPLLIEIGTEELPAVPFLKELPNIESKWLNVLQEFALISEFDFFYTPRRLVIYHRAFVTKQEDIKEEIFGPPLSVAYDDKNSPTKAATGFAKKCGVELQELSTAKKGGKEVLFFVQSKKGKPSSELLPMMIEQFVKSLSFGKAMRWGSSSELFIRPIRWLSVMLGQESIDMSLLGATSLAHTFVHRQKSFEKVPFKDIKAYFDTLEKGQVVLFAAKRQEMILKQFNTLQETHNIAIDIDKDLLDEVVAITEFPTALLGTFDERFLELPQEVIITSMREHQRYFPVFQDNKLTNKFVVVSNAATKDFSYIISGNEKVLRARLSDALFFYENDLKRGLVNDGLEKVVYMQGLGTLEDKLKRETKIAHYILRTLVDETKQELSQSLNEVLSISKADLMSEMVYEFTELQGVIGYYYALKANYSYDVALAVKEQYYPLGEHGALPSTLLSAIVAMAVKIDALMGLFSIDEIPTGSRDPFALRRAANGIINIALTHRINIDFKVLFEALKDLYKAFDTTKLLTFMYDRLQPHYAINASIIKAVLASGENNILDIDKKIAALLSITNTDGFKEFVSLFKRVANISENVDITQALTIDTALLESSYEQALFDAYTKLTAQTYQSYEAKLYALYDLAPVLKEYFDNVMVNCEDTNLRRNRKNLVATIYADFLRIADIKEVTL